MLDFFCTDSNIFNINCPYKDMNNSDVIPNIKATEAYMNVVKEDSFNLYTDILNPLHMIIGDADHVGDALSNVDELVEFLIKKNPSVQNDLVEFVKSKEAQYNS